MANMFGFGEKQYFEASEESKTYQMYNSNLQKTLQI